MKKILLIGIIVSLLSLGAVSLASAQATTPPAPPSPVEGYPSGSMGRGGGRGAGMRGGFGAASGEVGPLHEFMLTALAKIFGLTPEELATQHEAGESLWSLLGEQGFSAEEFQAKMNQARSDALNQAAAAGAISPEQAEWMTSRMNRRWPEGYGPGSANCDGTGQRGLGRQGGGMRWYNQP